LKEWADLIDGVKDRRRSDCKREGGAWGGGCQGSRGVDKTSERFMLDHSFSHCEANVKTLMVSV